MNQPYEDVYESTVREGSCLPSIYAGGWDVLRWSESISACKLNLEHLKVRKAGLPPLFLKKTFPHGSQMVKS